MAGVESLVSHLTAAEVDVLRERVSQRSRFTAESDAAYEHGELPRAAAAYAVNAGRPQNGGCMPLFWPWDEKWWKPRSPREDLVRAAALCIAAIEKIDAAPPAAPAEPVEPATPEA